MDEKLRPTKINHNWSTYEHIFHILKLISSFSSFVELNSAVRVEQKAIPRELSVTNADVTGYMCII